MKRTSVIFIISTLIMASFFGCKKTEFNEDEIDLTIPAWETITTENSDLLSNNIKSLKYQKSKETMWVLSKLGLQSYKDGNFTSYNAFAFRNIDEIYLETENNLLFKTNNDNVAATFNRFNTDTQKATLATELDWNKVKYGIDFTYKKSTENSQTLIIEGENIKEELDFETLINDNIEAEASQLTFKDEVLEFVLDTAKFLIIKSDSICSSFLPDTIPYEIEWSNFFTDYCNSEIVDTIFEEVVLLSDGTKLSFNLNEFDEKPVAYKYIDYNSNTMPFLKKLSTDDLNLGRKECWLYPSNEVCNDLFNLNPEFHFEEVVVDKNKTIYIKVNNQLAIYKKEVFQNIQFNMKGYSFLLIDGEVYLTDKNSVYKIDADNQFESLYSSPVDCQMFGNGELQGFAKIDDDLWITNCEYIVRCQAGNCNNRIVELPSSNLFNQRSSAIEVIDSNLIWIGYNNEGIYLVEWNKLEI